MVDTVLTTAHSQAWSRNPTYFVCTVEPAPYAGHARQEVPKELAHGSTDGPLEHPSLDESISWLVTTLRKRVGHDATAARAADVMDQLLRQIDGALTPVIGQRGVVLLYRRALFLNVAAHPWMARAEPATSHVLDFAPLKAVSEQQSTDAVVAGGSALLQSFYELLSSLVGVALTEQLLRCVWASPPGGQSAQDN